MTVQPKRAKLTKGYVDKVVAGTKDDFHWDTEVKGFGLRVTPAGKVTFIVQAKVIGQEGSLPPDLPTAIPPARSAENRGLD